MDGPGRERSSAATNDRADRIDVPPEVRELLQRWIDVDEISEAEFWRWLGAVLPLLPRRDTTNLSAATPPRDRLRELATDLVECASDRARLSVACDQYFRDNQLLARRVKALEAILRTANRAGRPTESPDDERASRAAERYLPPSRPRP